MNVKYNKLKASLAPGQDHMKERIRTLEHVISSKIKIINGLASRNGGRGLINVLLRYVRGVRPKATKSVVRQVAGFTFFVGRLVRHSGLKGAVLYLKACQVLLQQSVGGYRVVDLADLKVRPKRNRSGLPLIIPAGVRRMIIRDRDIPSIRLWMTLFGLFRILQFVGKFSLSTIVEPGVEVQESFIPKWEKWLKKEFMGNLPVKFPPIPKVGIFPILKSGPTTESTPFVNSSGFALVRAARLWVRAPWFSSLEKVAKALGAPVIPNRIRLVAMSSDPTLDSTEWAPYLRLAGTGKYPGKGYLGKLGFKLEPAGKIRVFAMVDAWTQWLMAPLHQWIFGILSQLSDVDGTFDQMRPIVRLQNLWANKPKGRTFSSIDLSAATDRLPIALQESLLKVILKDVVPDSQEFASAWADLLVGRRYSVEVSQQVRQNSVMPQTLPKDVMYAVGQPMGALSSWAMLALTHHAIVQYAASRAGIKGWFSDYGVLGDDIVICHGKVAWHYRQILREIGVSAGLAKSIVARSKFVVEFAKKFFVDQTTANMLPLKECIAVDCSTSLVVEFVRKYNFNLNSILAFLGYGYKSRMWAVQKELFELGTRLRVLLVWLKHPSSPLGLSDFAEWILVKSWGSKFQPSIDCLYDVWYAINRACTKRAALQKRVIERYEQSIKDSVQKLDKAYPVMITTPNLVGSTDRGFERSQLSWSNILNEDLSMKTEVDVDYASKGLFSLDRRDTHGHQIAISQEIHRQWMWGFQSVLGPPPPYLTEGFLKWSINEMLQWYFGPNPTDMIPEKFWEEDRKELRPFRDFLEVYKLWQEWTKPIWSEYYKSRKVKALGKQESLEDLIKRINSEKPEMELYPSKVTRSLEPCNFFTSAWVPTWWEAMKDSLTKFYLSFVRGVICSLLLWGGFMILQDHSPSGDGLRTWLEFQSTDGVEPQQFRVNPNWDKLIWFVSGILFAILCMIVFGWVGGDGGVNSLPLHDTRLIPLHTEGTFLDSESNLTRLPWPPLRPEVDMPRSPMFMRGYYEFLAND